MQTKSIPLSDVPAKSVVPNFQFSALKTAFGCQNIIKTVSNYATILWKSDAKLKKIYSF